MSNRLMGMRGYLSGGIEYTKPGDSANWRASVKELTKHLGILWLNPLEKPILENKIDEGTIQVVLKKARREQNYDLVADIMHNIRCIDLRMVDICDFMVVRLDSLLPTVGTYEEIVLANRQKKPIIMWYVQGKMHTPLWLFGMFPHETIFSSLSEVIIYLGEVDNGLHSDHQSRWLFWDACLMKPNAE